MRVLFFGDGPWATLSLQKLSTQTSLTLLGVVLRTHPSDPKLAQTAKELKLPIYQPTKVNASPFIEQVKKLAPELNLSVSYDQILKRAIRQTAPKGFVNFHAGKLPYYRGRNIVNWALINGETEIGLTAHYVDSGIDTGDIILQHTLPITRTDTYGTVLEKVIQAFPDLVFDTVSQIEQGTSKRQKQSHLMGTYFPARRPGDEWLNWQDTSENLYNKIRAITHPGPGARTLLDKQTIIIWQADYDPKWPRYIATPGEVVGRKRNKGIWVKTGDSTLFIQNIQIDQAPSTVPQWPIGTRLG